MRTVHGNIKCAGPRTGAHTVWSPDGPRSPPPRIVTPLDHLSLTFSQVSAYRVTALTAVTGPQQRHYSLRARAFKTFAASRSLARIASSLSARSTRLRRKPGLGSPSKSKAERIRASVASVDNAAARCSAAVPLASLPRNPDAADIAAAQSAKTPAGTRPAVDASAVAPETAATTAVGRPSMRWIRPHRRADFNSALATRFAVSANSLISARSRSTRLLSPEIWETTMSPKITPDATEPSPPAVTSLASGSMRLHRGHSCRDRPSSSS